MGQSLTKQDTTDILSYLPPRAANRIMEFPMFDRILGPRYLTIWTSKMTTEFMAMAAQKHGHITQLTVEIDDKWGKVDQTRDYHLDFPNLTHLVLCSARHIRKSETSAHCKPLNDWAQWLDTLDITDLTTHRDLQSVWNLFPFLHLRHFRLKWIGLYSLYTHNNHHEGMPHTVPMRLDSLHVTMDPMHASMHATQTSVYCMQWIKGCAVNDRSCALHCVVPKWTEGVASCFVEWNNEDEDNLIRLLPANSTFAHFHLEVQEIERDAHAGFFLLQHFVNRDSSVYVDIKATGVENNTSVRCIHDILEGLSVCKDMKTILRLKCSVWTDEMNLWMGYISDLILGRAKVAMQDGLFHKTLHVTITVSGGAASEIETKLNELKMRDNFDKHTGMLWDNMMKHKALTFNVIREDKPPNLKVKLNLPQKHKRDPISE